MLDSVKIQRRQSEIRQSLAELVGKEKPTEDEARSMEALDAEYRANETRYRAALIAEDAERRDAGADLETRSASDWRDLMARFELRQVALHLDEGRALDGATAEIVAELRGAGGYRGIPVPLDALEQRNTVASGTPDPVQTRPIIDRLFPQSVAARMGVQSVQIDAGAVEWPVVTSSVAAGWAATEGGPVADPVAFAAGDRAMAPNSTLGVQMRISRKALKQSGAGLEQAISRDLRAAIGSALDRAVFLGTGADGQPLGMIAGAALYGITATPVDAAATWAAIRAAVTRFIAANAAAGPGEVRLMIRPEVWNALDGALFDAGSGITEWARLTANIPAGNVAITSNALAAPAGTPAATTALLTTSAGGVAPAFLGLWGAVDMIRDPYSDAQSGGLRLTGLVTADVTVARGAQAEILTGLEV